jgi:hypothetical protein
MPEPVRVLSDRQMRSHKSNLLVGFPILLALLACGGASEEVVVESPDEPEREVILVPASRPAPQPQPQSPGTKVKKKTTYPDGTEIETETEIETDD